MSTSSDQFPTDTAGLPASRPTEVVEVPGGGRVELRVAPVTKQIGDATVRMLAYNGSIPGPTLRVRQDSEIDVDVVNEGDMDATVHWHGLRLDNRFDGTHETQAPIPVGGRFTSRVAFPDPGVYWYHPHIREDYGQEMGLYGNVLVDPGRPRLLGAGAPRARPHARRHPDRGRPGRGVRASETTTRRWAASATSCSSPASPTSRSREDRRSRPGVPDQHREHARVQGQAAGRADEARRRRQRPCRARGVRRGRWCWRRPSAPSSTCCSTRPANSRWSTTHPSAPTRWRRSRSATSAPSRRWMRRSRACAAIRSSRRSASGIEPFVDGRARQDARVRGRDGVRGARGPGRLRMPDASGRRQRGTRPLPDVRHDAAGDRRAATTYACPMHPEVSARSPAVPAVRHEAARDTAPATASCPMHPDVTAASPAGARVRDELLPRVADRAGDRGTSTTSTPAIRGPRSRRGGRDRVGRRHGRGQQDHDAGQHALEVDRPVDRRGEPRRSSGSSPSATG